jgi:hypothetical protein
MHFAGDGCGVCGGTMCSFENEEPCRPVKARFTGSFLACDDNMNPSLFTAPAVPVFETGKMKNTDARMRSADCFSFVLGLARPVRGVDIIAADR